MSKNTKQASNKKVKVSAEANAFADVMIDHLTRQVRNKKSVVVSDTRVPEYSCLKVEINMTNQGLYVGVSGTDVPDGPRKFSVDTSEAAFELEQLLWKVAGQVQLTHDTFDPDYVYVAWGIGKDPNPSYKTSMNDMDVTHEVARRRRVAAGDEEEEIPF